MAETEDEAVAPAAEGVGRAGRAPWLTLVVDSDGDGQPDTGFAKAVAGAVSMVFAVVRPFAAPGTWVASAADQWFTKVIPAIGAVTK